MIAKGHKNSIQDRESTKKEKKRKKKEKKSPTYFSRHGLGYVDASFHSPLLLLQAFCN
jgi:hypothetical protein